MGDIWCQKWIRRFTFQKCMGVVRKSWQPCCLPILKCIYKKVAVSTLSKDLCLSYHIAWRILRGLVAPRHWHKDNAFWTLLLNYRQVRRIKRPTWIEVLVHILMYLWNKSMEFNDFWNAYISVNFLSSCTLFDSNLWHIHEGDFYMALYFSNTKKPHLYWFWWDKNICQKLIKYFLYYNTTIKHLKGR